MPIHWTSIQKPFRFQRGFIGMIRQYLPSRLGGLSDKQYDYATEVYDLAKAKGDSFCDIEGFSELLAILSKQPKNAALYTHQKTFLRGVYAQLDIELNETTLKAFAEHWPNFETHLVEITRALFDNAHFSQRLYFAKELLESHKTEPGNLRVYQYYCKSRLLTSESIRKAFISADIPLDGAQLHFIFDTLHDAKTLLTTKLLRDLVEQDETHPLSNTLLSNFSSRLKTKSEAFSAVSDILYERSEKLDIPLLQRILNLFKPSEQEPPAFTLNKETLLTSFIDRLIELKDTPPSKNELKLFNQYRLETAASDPYYYLIAKSFSLTPNEKVDIDWMNFDKEQYYRFNELPPYLKIKLFPIISSEVQSIIVEKMKTDEYGVQNAGVPVNHTTKFDSNFKKHVAGNLKSDAIGTFISRLTKSGHGDLGQLKDSHPIIVVLKKLKDIVSWLDKSDDIRHFKIAQEQENRYKRFCLGDINTKMLQFKKPIKKKEAIDERTIDKAASSFRGVVDEKLKCTLMSEILKQGGKIRYQKPTEKKVEKATPFDFSF
jgi:hypothetical protein